MFGVGGSSVPVVEKKAATLSKHKETHAIVGLQNLPEFIGDNCIHGFICISSKKEREPKYTSVPNVLLCWTTPLVLQAINTLFLHNLAEVIHRLQGRGADPQGIPVQHTEHITVTCFSVFLSYVARCIGAVIKRHHRIPINRMVHKISID